jgi:hypothetical protein
MPTAPRKVEFDGVLRLTRSVNHSLRGVPTGGSQTVSGRRDTEAYVDEWWEYFAISSITWSG